MSIICQTLQRQILEYTPVWLMRQAGRYLPEYRKIREKAGSFLSLCKNPELATEVSLQPLRRFALDSAILFSDILVVPEAMGLYLYFSEAEGPKFANPIKSTVDIDNLAVIDPTVDLDFVMQTIRNLKQELPAHIPLIGFSGSPWTLACYMIEGGSSTTYTKAKTWLYSHPQALHSLLSKLTIAVADYLISQIKTGVDIIMIFDSWGGILSESAFCEFSQAYLRQVLLRIKTTLDLEQISSITPSIVFTRGGGIWLNHLEQLPCQALSIDWTLDIGRARSLTTKILQGNLDPIVLLSAPPAILKQEIHKILSSYYAANQGDFSGLIFNLGHGVLPGTPVDNVACLVDTVHELSWHLHKG